MSVTVDLPMVTQKGNAHFAVMSRQQLVYIRDRHQEAAVRSNPIGRVYDAFDIGRLCLEKWSRP